ncbi:MAG: nitroreductase family protein [Candidatus Thorarchaeota archaeon]
MDTRRLDLARSLAIRLLLEAGKSAPSSGNIQNWKFIVILEKPKR